MDSAQPGILAPIPLQARYLHFSLQPDADPDDALRALAAEADGDGLLVGLGASLMGRFGSPVPGLRLFPAHSAGGVDIPSTPFALWCWLRGDDRGVLVQRTRALRDLLAPAFALELVTDAFRYRDFRDLTGYEDGTENPQDDDAVAAALVPEGVAGLAGSSFVAVQLWEHDLDLFAEMSPEGQDDIMGRRRIDNEELDDAPPSAHVKRTAQESFEPEAFILRRSMPWADDAIQGLVFVAFGHSFDAFEALLRRMSGEEDGISDALFRFTRPLTGAYFWCPPLRDGQLDLSLLGL